MSNKIEETKENLKKLGYFSSDELAKIVTLFEASGKREKKSIPTLLLSGKSGAGKTFLAETFAEMIGAEEKFVQCFPRMGTENFQYDVNIEGVMKQEVDNSIKPGILLQTIEQSYKGPVVLVIDELDKARPEVDSFLLDFLENGRLTTGTDTYKKGDYPIYTFITSNDKRDIDDALLNRSKRVEVPRPSKELFLEILGLPENHYIGFIYDKCPDFSIRQAKQYMEDLEILGVDIDKDALSQYINLEQLNVMSLKELQYAESLKNNGVEIDLPNLKSCEINLTRLRESVIPTWIKLLSDSGKDFEFISKNEDYYGGKQDIYVVVKSIEQLEILKKYGIEGIGYDGWFSYEMNEEEMNSENIIWASNKDEKDGTRFGIKIVGDKMFRIAMNKGYTFVYLDSSLGTTLENFYGKELVEDYEQDYETDDEYEENDRYYEDDDDRYNS